MTITNILNRDELTFTMNAPVCYVNALRRTILSDIETACFITSPEKDNTLEIDINTSGLNNEIIKQRFSNIPIHIKDLTIPLNKLEIQIDVKNTSSTVLNVTTKDIQIYDQTSEKYLNEKDVNTIFPPDPISGSHILICRLRPSINDEIPGEHLKCKSVISVSTASNLGCYNVAHTCTYKFMRDLERQEQSWLEVKSNYITDDDTTESEEAKKKNWLLGEGTKIVIRNMFEFTLETVGVYSNIEIMNKAFDILIGKIENYISKTEYIVKRTETLMKNGYDIEIPDDYTIGYILQHVLFEEFYEKEKILSFVGFKKVHPHDAHSLLKIAFISDDSSEETIVSLIKRACELTKAYLEELNSKFA